MESGGGRAGWMREWDKGERREQGWMDVGVGLERQEGAGLAGLGSGMRETGGGRAGWMGKRDEGERRGQGWMDGGVG